MKSLNDLRENERQYDFEDALKQELTNKIRAYRIFKGLSIEELAKKSGVSVEYIEKIEGVEEDAEFSTLYALSKALNLKIQLDIVDLDSLS